MPSVSFGTLNLSSGESLTSPTFVMNSGTVGGSDTITVTGLFTWLGGTLGGTGTLNANGGIDLSNPFGIFLRNTRVLNNSATATWTGAGSFGNDTGATFNNLLYIGIVLQRDLDLEVAGPVSGQRNISWTTQAGMTNTLEFLNDFSAGTWQPLTNILGNGSRFEVTDPSSDRLRIYRVRLPE